MFLPLSLLLPIEIDFKKVYFQKKVSFKFIILVICKSLKDLPMSYVCLDDTFSQVADMSWQFQTEKFSTHQNSKLLTKLSLFLQVIIDIKILNM